MANPNSLNLKDEPLPTSENFDYDTLPEFGGEGREAWTAGAYTGHLPADLSELWSTFDYKPSYKGGKPGQRVSVSFDSPATITVASSPDGQHIGEGYQGRLSTAERSRDKEGLILASDIDYLLAAVQYRGPKPQTNKETMALVNKVAAGKLIGWTNEYVATCRDGVERYVAQSQNEDGSVKSVKQAGVNGCGEKYYHSDIPSKDGKKVKEFPCQCGAWLRCFNQMANVRGLTK